MVTMNKQTFEEELHLLAELFDTLQLDARNTAEISAITENRNSQLTASSRSAAYSYSRDRIQDVLKRNNLNPYESKL